MNYRMNALVVAALSAAGALASAAKAEVIYAVTTQQFLVSFDTSDPSALLSASPLIGLQQGDSISGLDFRPATGELYMSSCMNNLYKVDFMTGNVLSNGSAGFNLSGAAFGFDFNPMIDRIRIVTDVNNNYVFNPMTLALQTVATDLAFVAGDMNAGQDPNIVHSAYTNNFNGAPSTQLYGIDSGLDRLVTQANNAGTLATVGALGVNITSLGGFDISGTTGMAYGVFQTIGEQRSSLYSINLTTGAATNLGEIGGGLVIEGMTVVPVVPSTGTFCAVGFLGGLFAVRRRR